MLRDLTYFSHALITRLVHLGCRCRSWVTRLAGSSINHVDSRVRAARILDGQYRWPPSADVDGGLIVSSRWGWQPADNNWRNRDREDNRNSRRNNHDDDDKSRSRRGHRNDHCDDDD